jgi:hypothetical protein
MNRFGGMLGSLAALASALALGPALPARGDTVRVHKTVNPVVAATANFQTACLLNTVKDAPLINREVSVGFGGICGAARGMVLFKISDIPHHFKLAALRLRVDQVTTLGSNVAVALAGVFETSFTPFPPATFCCNAGGSVDPADGSMTLSLDSGLFADTGLTTPLSQLQSHAVSGTVPFSPSPGGVVVEEKPPFGYRIDVTKSVTGWVADWLNRDKAPLHGFILVGSQEGQPGDATLVVTYKATLEFDIDEPVQ